MDVNQIWEVISPYIMTVVGAFGGGTVVFALVRILVGGFLKKFSAKYDVNDMADRVAGRLAGKTLNIDVTAVTEKRLDKIDKRLSKQVEELSKQTTDYKHLLALIGSAVAHFKALPDEEKTALTEAVRALESDYTPPEPEEITTVKLEPITLEAVEEPEEGGLVL